MRYMVRVSRLSVRSHDYDFTNNILLVAARLFSEATFGSAPKNRYYFIDKKSLKNSSRKVHSSVRVQIAGLQRWYNYLWNILGWLLPYAISNTSKENFATYHL